TSARIAADAVDSTKIKSKSISSTDIQDNAVITANIRNANVTLAKLAANSVDSTKIVDKSVSSADIQDKAVTAAKLNSMSATSGQVLKYNGSAWAPAADAGLATEADGIIGNEVTTATASGGLTRSGSGTAGSPYTLGIADGGVTSARITDGAVTSAKIADKAVTIAKINPGTSGQVLTTSGTSVAWAADQNTTYSGSTSITLDGTSFKRAALTGDVTASANSNATTIADGAVTSAKIKDANVTTAKIADAAVTTDKIKDKAVTIAKINPGTSGQVLTTSGTSVAWADAKNTTYSGSTSITLDGTSFKRAALTGDVTASADNNATTIAANAVTSAKIKDGEVAEADLASNAVTTAKIKDANVTTAKIADAAVTTDKIKDKAVTTIKIDPGTNGQILTTVGSAAVWSGTTPKAGQVLYYNGTGWAAGNINSYSLTKYLYIPKKAITPTFQDSFDVSDYCTVVNSAYITNFVQMSGETIIGFYKNEYVTLSIDGTNVVFTFNNMESYDDSNASITFVCTCIK
ncbi:MAG: hypothetical protein LBG15_00480, partial [Dysgonamonadaceae bacterium]|nr:hypothetical protein [Dysgonamonadaceae bacterium]